jgi:L-fuconolactonase
MRIIDSHAHIWIHDQEYPWAPEESDIPQYDARPDALIEAMQAHGVEQTVLVQYIKYKWDNRFVANVLKSYPSLFMGICRVDPLSPGGLDQLSYWTEEQGFKGVRLGYLPDTHRDWLSDPYIVPLFKRAAALKVPVIMLMTPARLPDLAAVLERVPDVDVVLDHMADFIDEDNGDLQKLLELSRYPRLYLKLSHLAVYSQAGFPWPDTHALMQRVLQVYGAPRVMWGSDWPFSLATNTFAQSIAYVRDELKFLTQEDKEWILGRTALQIWPFAETDDHKTRAMTGAALANPPA